MAEPARRLDPVDPKVNPANAIPSSAGAIPPERDPRFQSANQDARVDNRPIVEKRGAGSGVIIAGIVVVLAVIAYFMFAPGAEAPAPGDPATTSEPAAPPAAPAPDATAPAAPVTPPASEPNAIAPAEPATPPATEAPAPAAPAQPAPAAPQN
ncbi:MAG: hypothetical protein AB7P20_18630 [Rhizobiaceae bacterium]